MASRLLRLHEKAVDHLEGLIEPFLSATGRRTVGQRPDRSEGYDTPVPDPATLPHEDPSSIPDPLRRDRRR